YAPHDADVQSVSATDGQRVKRGAPLLTLRSLALEAERDQAESKLQTAQARMDVIDIEMVTETDTEDKTGRQSRLAAERRELELLCKLHQQRVSEVKDQLRELQMTSPIDGEVLSWMVRSELSDRPVTRGQHLLTIGDVEGPWVVELDVRDVDAYHLLQASADGPLETRIVLDSVPGRSFQGRLTSLSPSATTTESGRSTIRAVAEVSGDAAGLRPGAEAVASITCRQTCLGYAWLRDLIDAARSWLWR
ncbi:MAG: efflux RND transporter periplasmic adaptor subunit, partial [Planctomycetales bacterium]|nr:efflux RND transporter periplasmic adaptor subunit [Planctomycetales bacterium]